MVNWFYFDDKQTSAWVLLNESKYPLFQEIYNKYKIQ